MDTVASEITSLTIVYTTVYSDADQSKHQSSASLAFVWGIHRGPVNSPHKWPVTRKMLPFDDAIMLCKANNIHARLMNRCSWTTVFLGRRLGLNPQPWDPCPMLYRFSYLSAEEMCKRQINAIHVS